MAFKPHKKWSNPEGEQKIWRYMDFTKFMDLMINQSLFFTRIDRFEDKFEGAQPTGYLEFVKQAQNPYALVDHYDNAEILPGLKMLTLVNCWHMNEYESAAMWNLYLKSNEGIALQTTFKKLADSIIDKRTVTAGSIEYVDFKKHDNYIYNPTDYFILKRKSFEHERELRLFLVEEELPDTEELKSLKEGKFEVGDNVKVDVSNLIENLYISPTSPQWFHDLVEKTANQVLGYNINVQHSELSELPT